MGWLARKSARVPLAGRLTDIRQWPVRPVRVEAPPILLLAPQAATERSADGSSLRDELIRSELASWRAGERANEPRPVALQLAEKLFKASQPVGSKRMAVSSQQASKLAGQEAAAAAKIKTQPIA